MEELQESLEKIQPAEYPLRRKYSDSNFVTAARPKAPPPVLRQRKSVGRDQVTSPKIIEVLDPKTASVVQRESIAGRTKITTLSGLRTVSLKDVFRNFAIHKRQFHKDYAQIKRTLRRCCCELFLILVFCGLGGLMFKFTEGTFETYYKCGVKRVKRDFIDLLWTKSHNLREDDWKSLARSRLRMFEEELHSAHEAGMTDYSGMRSWSFLNGIVYCLTIVTTIGKWTNLYLYTYQNLYQFLTPPLWMWRNPNDSRWMTSDNWQFTNDKWHLTCKRYPLFGLYRFMSSFLLHMSFCCCVSNLDVGCWLNNQKDKNAWLYRYNIIYYRYIIFDIESHKLIVRRWFVFSN